MFPSTEEEEALQWEIRVKIAIGTAQELRMHNIMLDEVVMVLFPFLFSLFVYDLRN